MDSQFSPRIKDIIGYSREEAIRLGNDYIGQEHLFFGNFERRRRYCY